MTRLNFSISIVIFIVFLISVEANARTYKCKDKDGNITYSQTACSNDQKTDKVMGGRDTKSNKYDCKYAKKFANTVAKGMKAGADSSQIFDQYGGINSLSKGPINIINYIYTYKHDEKISVQRISSLAHAKCKAKSFGGVNCEDFPENFTSTFGGCDTSDEETDSTQDTEPEIQEEEITFDKVDKSANDSKKAKEREDKLQKEKEITRCKAGYQSKIDSIDKRMKGGYSSSEGEKLRAERRNLRKTMQENCR